MATFEAIQQRVSSRLKDANNVDVSVSDVSATINDAIRYWSKRRFIFNTFRETVDLNPGDATVPALSITPLEVFETDGMVIDYANQKWPLKKISSEEYDDMDSQGRGTPFVWVYRNNSYEVYWLPDQDYTVVVRGIKKYDNLVNNVDTNDFTDNAEDLIIYEALARLMAEFRQDEKMEAYYSARAKDEYKNHKREVNKQIGTGRLQIRGL